MNKEARLAYLKSLGEKHDDRQSLQFAGIPPTRDDVDEALSDMDTFREAARDTETVLTSDQV